MKPAPRELGALIDARPMAGLQLLTLVLCALVVAVDGYDIQIMALAVPAVAEAWRVPPSHFGLVLTASIVGIGLGGAFVAPLADRLGRKPVLVSCLALTAAATLASAYASSLDAFVAWRLLTGLGMGAAQPVATALTAEYMPARRRAWLVTVMFCNSAVGAFIAGFTAPLVMGALGWRGLFLVGGGAVAVVVLLLLFGVPESVRFLLARRPGATGVARILGRLAPDIPPGEVVLAAEAARRRSVLDLVGADYRWRTLLLWAAYSCNAFVTYLLISWLPTLLRQAGWASGHASQGAVLFQAGGVIGGLVLSSQVDRGRTVPALLAGYALSAAALVALKLTTGMLLWSGLILLVGAGVSGSQFVLVSLAAGFYPVSIRAAGVGWAGTVSRVGAVAAPLFGAWAIGVAGPAEVLGMMLAPVALCAGLSLMIRREWMAGQA